MAESLQSVGTTVTELEAWQIIFSGEWAALLEKQLLPQFIQRQRWFGSKSRSLASTAIVDWGLFNHHRSVLLLVQLNYEVGEADTYLLPLSISAASEAAAIQKDFPAAILGPAPGEGILHDALYSQAAASALLALIREGASLQMQHGAAKGCASAPLASLHNAGSELEAGSELRSRLVSTEQSNSSVIYGNKLIMKLFRKQAVGINPDIEIGRYLTGHSNFGNIAPFGGSIEYYDGSRRFAFALLQGLVANQGDGWEWTLKQLLNYFERNSAQTFPVREAESFPTDLHLLSNFEMPRIVQEYVGPYLEAAARLGRRTGEMHAALGASTTNDSFAPLPFSAIDSISLRSQMLATATRAFETLSGALPHIPSDTLEAASRVLSWRERIFGRLADRTSGDLEGMQIRVHGDYHLGQVLRTESDFVILDFEGEPARTLEERRAKQSPLKDVAGMLRSFSYAAFTALTRYTAQRPEESGSLECWAHLWESAVTAEFLKAYRRPLEGSSILPAAGFEALLEAFVLDKALYELIYELNNRPLWIKVPLHGILSLSQE